MAPISAPGLVVDALKWITSPVALLAALYLFTLLATQAEKSMWKWFMAVDAHGSWVTITGIAALDVDATGMSGTMWLGEDGSETVDAYSTLSAAFDDDGSIDMRINTSQPGVHAFDLSGRFYQLVKGGLSAYTFVLTDGTTVLGFAKHELEER